MLVKPNLEGVVKAKETLFLTLGLLDPEADPEPLEEVVLAVVVEAVVVLVVVISFSCTSGRPPVPAFRLVFSAVRALSGDDGAEGTGRVYEAELEGRG